MPSKIKNKPNAYARGIIRFEKQNIGGFFCDTHICTHIHTHMHMYIHLLCKILLEIKGKKCNETKLNCKF